MEKYFRQILLPACSIFLALLCFAGDVSYTLWEDEDDQIWVRIENGSEQRIKVETILLVFYDSKGKPVEQKQFPCTEHCLLASHDVGDFGPYSKQPGAESCRLQKVRYVIQ